MRAWLAAGLLLSPGLVGAQDTIRVRGTMAPWSTKPVALNEVMTVGRLDGPPEYALGTIEAIAVDAKGRMYTYDSKDQQIRAYDPSGQFVRLIGRKGSGPGEYRGFYGMGILGDSILAVFDLSNKWILQYLPDGKVLRQVQQPRLSYGFDRGTAATKSGLLMYRVMQRVDGRSDVEMPFEPPPGMKIEPPHMLRFRADGSLLDSVRLGAKTKFMRGFYIVSAGHLSFVPDMHVALSPTGGAVFGESDQYRFVIREPSGRVRVVEQTWTPLPLAGEERDNWQEYADYFKRRRPTEREYVLPKTKPAYRDLFADQDGRVWVGLYAAATKRDVAANPDRPVMKWLQDVVYDVFDPQGKYLGRVGLPHGSRVLWSQGDRMWVLGKGPDDEERIAVYRLGEGWVVKDARD